ncbi:MAG: hypothetical protein N2593_03700 [Patescibacteria group bacterium]|nr:hypothetical protein [Patescibacteria group bacterium]
MIKKNQDLENAVSQLESVLENYLVDKAPFSIPSNIKELMVKFAPYLTIISIVLSVFSILSVLGLSVFLSHFSPFGYPRYGFYLGFSYILSMIVLAVSVSFKALAVSGLFKRKEKAWRFLFYASIFDILSNLIYGGIFGALIGALISWYVLFQVKEYYKN